MSAARDVTGILVQHIGEQKKTIPPLAFMLAPEHVQTPNTFRMPLAIKHLWPRVYICTADELGAMAAVREALDVSGDQVEKKQAPKFATAITLATHGSARSTCSASRSTAPTPPRYSPQCTWASGKSKRVNRSSSSSDWRIGAKR